MAHQLRELAPLPENLSLFLSTHVRQLTTVCNSSSKESDALFWLLQAHTHTHTLEPTTKGLSRWLCGQVQWPANGKAESESPAPSGGRRQVNPQSPQFTEPNQQASDSMRGSISRQSQNKDKGGEKSWHLLWPPRVHRHMQTHLHMYIFHTHTDFPV